MAISSGHGLADPNLQGIHAAYQWIFTDATTRAAGTPIGSVPVDATGIGKFGLQDDTQEIWLLTGFGPITWAPVSAGGGVPTAHASTHFTGGSDELTPGDIGAATDSHASTHFTAGSDPLTPADINAANLVHTHPFTDITGTAVIAQIPTATAGEVSATKVPLANDPRLARPLSYDWYMEDVNGAEVSYGPLRIAASELCTGSVFTLLTVHLMCKVAAVADVEVDIETCATPGGTWVSIFPIATRPIISAGNLSAITTIFESPGTVAPGRYFRMSIVDGETTGLTVAMIMRSY